MPKGPDGIHMWPGLDHSPHPTPCIDLRQRSMSGGGQILCLGSQAGRVSGVDSPSASGVCLIPGLGSGRGMPSTVLGGTRCEDRTAALLRQCREGGRSFSVVIEAVLFCLGTPWSWSGSSGGEPTLLARCPALQLTVPPALTTDATSVSL